jgi:ribose 5-phosphate isomerase
MKLTLDSIVVSEGGGGALLREKMVEICSDKFIVVGPSA